MSEALDSTTNEPVGLGGWLILPIIGLVVSVIMTASNLWIGLRDFGALGWSTAYQAMPGVTVFSGLSLFLGAVGIGFAVYCLNLIFNKDWRAPKFVIWFLLFMAVVGTFEAGVLYYFSAQLNDPSLIENEPRDTIRAWVGCAIWIPYFLKSKRVKNTFIERG